MKKSTTKTFIVVSFFLASVTIGLAGPVSGSNINLEYLFGGSDLSRFSVGGTAVKRSVMVGAEPGFTEYEMTMKKVTAFIGYDVLRWLTVFATAGTVDTRLDSGYYPAGWHQDYNGAEGEFGGGVVLNIIDYDIADPVIIEDRIRLSLNAEYTVCKTRWQYATATVEWEEFYTSAIVSLINEIHGNKLFWPRAIGLFAGPVYSHIQSSSIEHDGQGGFTTGLAIICSDNVTIDLGIESIESASFITSVNVKF